MKTMIDRIVAEIRRSIHYYQDWVFVSLIAYAAFSILVSGNILIRIELVVLLAYAYKVIIWSLFSLLVLRRVYPHKYLLAFLFYYPLSEAIGTTYYVLFHQYWTEFVIQWTAQIFVFFPIIATILFYLVKPKIDLNKFIIPFVFVILIWSLLGYHVDYDICCSAISVLSPQYHVPLYTEVFDSMWLLTYLFWIYGCNRPTSVRMQHRRKRAPG